jgi:transcriptional regulator with XRE-family HTH domain
MSFIEQIERQREKLGLTIQAVADRLHRPHDTVRTWLNGTRTPNPHDLARLANAVGLRTLKVPTHSRKDQP